MLSILSIICGLILGCTFVYKEILDLIEGIFGRYERFYSSLIKIIGSLVKFSIMSFYYFKQLFLSVFLIENKVIVMFRALFGLILFIAFYNFLVKNLMIDISQISTLYSILGFVNPDDSVTVSLTSFISRFISVLLPLSITFYIFTYRERKLNASSAVRQKDVNQKLIIFIISSLVTISFTTKLNSNVMLLMEQSSKPTNLDITIIYLNQLIISFLFFFLSLLLGTNLIRNLWLRLDSSKSLKLNIKQIRKMAFELSFSSRFKYLRNYRDTKFEDINLTTESVFQILEQSIDNSMLEFYSKSVSEVEKLLHYVHQEILIYKLANEERYSYLLRCYKVQYLTFYKTMLRCQINLIIKLSKKHLIDHQKNALKNFFFLSPKGFAFSSGGGKDEFDKLYQDMVNEFLISSYELLLALDEADKDLNNSLDHLILIANTDEYINNTDIFVILKALLINAIEKNDIDLLNLIQTTSIKIINSKNKQKQKDNIVNEDNLLEEVDISKLHESLQNNRFKEPSNVEELKRYTAISMLLAILKTIEIGKYNLTGHLIKLLVSHFEDTIISYAYDFISEDFSYFSSGLLGDKIDANFKFNEVTMKYCFEKLSILLFLQQEYATKNNLFFYDRVKTDAYSNVNISKALSKCNSIDYLFMKIENIGLKYGMIFFKDDNFYPTTKQKLKFLIRNSVGL